MKIGSMCSGYGGLEAGVRMVLGGDIAWVADSDPDASRVLAQHHPGIPNHGDITRADWAAVEQVDVLTAGFPCQPVSQAGQRKGVHDERWLFDDIAAAAGRMGSRPRLLVLENVEGLLSANGGNALARVVQGLAALGYVGRYRVVRASDAGAPHSRKRWFCVAWLAEDADRATRAERRVAAAGEAESRGSRADSGRPGGARTAADADAGRRGTGEHVLLPGKRDAGRGAPADTERGGRDGRSHDQERGEEGRAAAWRDSDAAADTGLARLGEQPGGAPAEEAGALAGDLIAGDHGARAATDWGPYTPAIGRWERVLGRPAPRPTLPSGRDGAERLNPVFVEWMMGADKGHVTGVPGLSRNAMLKILGNGCVPQQVALAVRLLAPAWALPGEVAA